MSSLRAPWQNGPYNNQHTEWHKTRRIKLMKGKYSIVHILLWPIDTMTQRTFRKQLFFFSYIANISLHCHTWQKYIFPKSDKLINYHRFQYAFRVVSMLLLCIRCLFIYNSCIYQPLIVKPSLWPEDQWRSREQVRVQRPLWRVSLDCSRTMANRKWR